MKTSRKLRMADAKGTDLLVPIHRANKKYQKKRLRYGTGVTTVWGRLVLENKLPPFRKPRVTLGEAIEHFLEYVVKPQATPQRFRKFRNHINYFVEFCGPKMPLNKINEPVLCAYRDSMLLGQRSVSTVTYYMSGVQSFLRCCAEEWHLIPRAPYIRMFKSRRARIRFLTPEEERRLLAHCKNPLKNFIKFLLGTGFRYSEAKNLTWRDVDLGHQGKCRARIPMTKNGQAHSVPLTASVAKMLREMRKRAPRKIDFVFTEIPTRNRRDRQGELVMKAGVPSRYGRPYADLEKARKAAELSDVTFHTMRHTFATRLILAGVSLFAVAHLMNHRSVHTTMKYAHLMPGYLDEEIVKLEKFLLAA